MKFKSMLQIPPGLTLAMLLSFAGARADDIESAVRAALNLRPAHEFSFSGSPFELGQSFDVFSHRFGVRPAAVVEKSNDGYTLAGTLTHAHRNDTGSDEIAWRVTRTRRSIVGVTWQLNGGMPRSLPAPMMQALQKFRTGRDLTGDQQREERAAAEAALRKAVDSSWQSAAQFLIARIALGDGC